MCFIFSFGGNSLRFAGRGPVSVFEGYPIGLELGEAGQDQVLGRTDGEWEESASSSGYRGNATAAG